MHNGMSLSHIIELRTGLPGGVTTLAAGTLYFSTRHLSGRLCSWLFRFCTLSGIFLLLRFSRKNTCAALDVLAFIEIKVNNYMGAPPPEILAGLLLKIGKKN
ncbi:hypothetical protein FXV91_18680 [Methanosarcina sp. DH2]|uniref:hypothetical protein n=1 Tax=Methanosarcina sp. DH2 TaxID=2605639 RepID=UPI001E33A543|nr:hypothetical protein [Methanosarcina sp. DH2]MCC4772113.1 hypothetical protein [Methanosarcina sp. DH2]